MNLGWFTWTARVHNLPIWCLHSMVICIFINSAIAGASESLNPNRSKEWRFTVPITMHTNQITICMHVYNGITLHTYTHINTHINTHIACTYLSCVLAALVYSSPICVIYTAACLAGSIAGFFMNWLIKTSFKSPHLHCILQGYLFRRNNSHSWYSSIATAIPHLAYMTKTYPTR